MIRLVVLMIFLHFPPGLSDVIQNPSRIFASQGSSVQLKCDHTLGSSYYQMYWYRQEQVSLTQIVYTVADTKPDFGSLSEEKYSAEKKNYASGSFTVKNLTADDSGSYFCVVSRHISTTLLCLTGSAVCNVVQNPPDLIKNQDEFAEISCAHTVKSCDRILWYKHTQATGFKFMGYLNVQSSKPEIEYEKKITLSGDGRNNGSLTITSLSVNDTAVYFCAAYYTVVLFTSIQCKNLHLISITTKTTPGTVGL
ncbi:hypothetical protein MHYP_G00133080 [Metynnis hypsauchen]